MGITIYSGTRHTFEDARHLISQLEDEFEGTQREKLETARNLLTEVENEDADQGLDL